MPSRARWTWSVGLFLGSLVVSAIAWFVWRIPLFFLLLIFPFFESLYWFGHRRTPETVLTIRECPRCDFSTDDPRASFCPRDASRLQPRQKPL